MKKYHIADLLTAIRLLIAVAIFGLTFSLERPDNWLVFWLFGVGELTDALDGEFARMFHYPRDRKRRPWREYNYVFRMYNYELLDIIADLALGLATALYISLWVSGWIGGLILGGAIALGFFVWRMIDSTFAIVSNEELREELKRRVIVRRRKWYVAALAVALVTLLWVSSVAILVRISLTILLALIGFLVYCAKRQTRLKDDKTPL